MSEFFDSIPCKDENEIIDVRDYFEHQFDNLFYIDKRFYVDNGVQYKRLHINFNIYGRAFVYARDVNGVRVHIDYVKFKKLYDIETAFGVETKNVDDNIDEKVADDIDYNAPCEFVEPERGCTKERRECLKVNVDDNEDVDDECSEEEE